MDCEVLRLLVWAVLKDTTDRHGVGAGRLWMKLVRLFYRITAKVTDIMDWIWMFATDIIGELEIITIGVTELRHDHRHVISMDGFSWAYIEQTSQNSRGGGGDGRFAVKPVRQQFADKSTRTRIFASLATDFIQTFIFRRGSAWA